ncbi:3-hydroxyisobutyrate dehydrogenase-like protein [Piedraia hortae CBS 480.64]|uniref:3-hydroxyisobutyrate dehydrogenase n=1 Tax=Piedraia hortae CBS 480.64 TaxID=1314780 RepID=A0A6A7BR02_9PEZI|nr:3-hydroxyisobutyrate dehydrogenase-like protein [Piedraia hortae CBS 480.64]
MAVTFTCLWQPVACQRLPLLFRSAARRGFCSGNGLRTDYGFIGLGQMGFPMAVNLGRHTPDADKLHVYDVNEKALDSISTKVGEKLRVEESVHEVAKKSDVIITALPEPSHVKSVFEQMLHPRLPSKQRLFIDCSTIDPMTSQEVANEVDSTGSGRFVDAPMSGGVVGATNKTLTFMIGSAPELVEQATAVLSMMGKRVVHLGPPTSGLKAKLANNYLLALNNIATAEALNLGVRWGLDAKKLSEMINTATGKCWPSDVNNPVPSVDPRAPASQDYRGGFGTKLMLKDLTLALKAAEEANVAPLLGGHAKDIYTAVEATDGCQNRDFSVVYKYLELR